MRGSGVGLELYADSDYADKSNDRRSVCGIAVILGGTVASHASNTQQVMQFSASKVEYITAGDGVKDALFVRAVLSFVANETSGACLKVFQDN